MKDDIQSLKDKKIRRSRQEFLLQRINDHLPIHWKMIIKDFSDIVRKKRIIERIS